MKGALFGWQMAESCEVGYLNKVFSLIRERRLIHFWFGLLENVEGYN